MGNGRTRILIVGETGKGKTYSLLTFPGPRVVMTMPGEKGDDSLPDDDPETIKINCNPVKMDTDSIQVIADTRRAIMAVAMGKHPQVKVPIKTLALDGVHKYYEYILDAMSGGAFFAGDPIQDKSQANPDVLDPKSFGQAKRWLFGLLNEVFQAPIAYIPVTMWDADKGERKVQQGEHWSKVPQHKMPALFGPASRDILGEFTVVVHASRGKINPTDLKPSWRWQTKATASIGAACIKAPKEVAEKIPTYVPADWSILQSYLNIPKEVTA